MPLRGGYSELLAGANVAVLLCLKLIAVAGGTGMVYLTRRKKLSMSHVECQGPRRVRGKYMLMACTSLKLAGWVIAAAIVFGSVGCNRSREDAHAREVANRVRTEFLHAWTNYEK